MHPGPFQSLMQATACFAAAKDHRHKKPRAALQAAQPFAVRGIDVMTPARISPSLAAFAAAG